MDVLPCPSFNAYATAPDTADKVTRESREDYCFLEPSMAQLRLENYEDEDFEFVTFHKPADEVYLDCQVDPVYPIFNRNVLNENKRYEKSQQNEFAIPENPKAAGMSLQKSLRNLFINEEDHRRRMINPPSSSSSEELDSIPPDSYCVWTPDSAKASPSRCKKSKSTGSSSSKRWKLLEFLCRSNSDGKDKFFFLTPSPVLKKKEEKPEISKEEWSSSPVSGNIPHGNKVAISTKAKMSPSSSAAVATGRSERKVSAHEVFYVRYRALKEVDKKRSFLPYRQDLVGFGANLGGFGTKTFPPS